MDVIKKISDINLAINVFLEMAEGHTLATETGDYYVANKCYKQLVKAATFLKVSNNLDKLCILLASESVGVKLWAASYLLMVNKIEAISTLEAISKGNGIHALTAKNTLAEWRKGNLKL